MAGAKTWAVSCGFIFGLLPVVRAGEATTAIIAASTVAGLILLSVFAGIVIFCFYRNGHFKKTSRQKKHRKHNPRKPHRTYSRRNEYLNGGPPQYEKHIPNGTSHIPRYPPEYPIFAEPVRHPYTTYHGPPPEFHQPQVHKTGSMRQPSGPVIVIPTSRGTVTMRADPRPVVKTYQWKNTTERRHKEHHGTRRNEPQEFIIEPSYNGVPVLRPVIYVDDDGDRRGKRYRDPAKKKSHLSSDVSPSEGPRITEIKSDTDVKTTENEYVANHLRPATPPRPRSRSRSPPAQKTPDLRSRASSVTAAVNQINMALVDDDDSGSDTSAARVPVDREVRKNHLAPDPVPGDVLFYPANMEAPQFKDRPTTTQTINDNEQAKETVYGYTKVIKADEGEREQTTVVTREIRATTSGSSHPISQTTNISIGRDTGMYETEHSANTGFTTDMRTSMSDRLTSMVEDGDKSRFSHYNVEAVKETTHEEHVEMRRSKRPNTPPNDIPRDSFYSTYAVPHQNRPATPPNDIPLITPRESSEIPRLNLASEYTSPRDSINGPLSPKTDYPVTPKLYFQYKAPTTPPYDADTSRSVTNSSFRQSVAVDPVTGEPGSFQARKRLIEAHLKSVGNTGSDHVGRSVPKYTYEQTEPQSQIQPINTVQIQPGVIPPAPPPPAPQ